MASRRARPTFNSGSKRLVDAIAGVFERFTPPLTVRQVYYQLATLGLVPLSRRGYRQAQRLLLRVREEGIIPWQHFADRTREVIRPSQWKDVQAFADTVGRAYRRDLWQSQPEHVEIWLEKDALSGFFEDVTRRWGVSLYVCRGFSSATFVFEAAEVLAGIDKPKHVYYFGDHDPSGLGIEEDLHSRLSSFGVDFHFQRSAITLADITTFDLQPLEAKATDSRFKGYVAEHGHRTIELDALPPDELRRRIEATITAHVDMDEWNRLLRVEELERTTIRGIAAQMGGPP